MTLQGDTVVTDVADVTDSTDSSDRVGDNYDGDDEQSQTQLSEEEIMRCYFGENHSLG